MPGTILVCLDQPAMAAALLHAGNRLAERGGGAAIRALILRTPPASTILPSEEILTTAQARQIRASEAARAASLAERFATWRSQATQPAELHDEEATAVEALATNGPAADIIVLARPTQHTDQQQRALLSAALFDTDRPVLLVPPGGAGDFGNAVAVAWRDDDRAVKAVRPVLHLLGAATRVDVLQGVRDGSTHLPVPEIFVARGIDARMHVLPIGQGAFGQTLLDQAHALGADLLVMGAYAHAPLREMIFGGVTRFMLDHADLPVLLRH
jgi:nucleotide-binding universal stress UspA family protein